MRKVSLALLGAACSIVSAGIASAADLPPRPAPPPAVAPVVVVPVFTWTGCYIGAHGGYGWGKKTFTDTDFELSNHDVTGGLAGGQVGCNYQTGSFVFGVEGQASWANLKGSSVFDNDPPNQELVTLNTKVDAIGTIAARFGFAVDRTLLYVKVGGAFAVEKHWATLNFDGSTFGQTNRYTRWGWMAGAGVEYAFTPNWSAKVEYNYMGLGTKSPEFCDGAGANCGSDTSVKQDLHIVKAGINYRFGGR